jgi:uncharacterized protein YdeI (YjbR/CyaY-like superfamily)
MQPSNPGEPAVSRASSLAPGLSHPGGALNPKVEWYFSKHSRWEQALRLLRTLVLDSPLTEELKWGCPCYTLGGSNVALIHAFKDYCALLLFKGALLKDDHGILIQQTKNVQAARQIRFTDAKEVVTRALDVKACLSEAIAVERSGLKPAMKKTAAFEVPAEFSSKLNELHALKEAFYALTPGRQRAYLLHFSSAKQSKTREARIQKCMARILDGKGLDDSLVTSASSR